MSRKRSLQENYPSLLFFLDLEQRFSGFLRKNFNSVVKSAFQQPRSKVPEKSALGEKQKSVVFCGQRAKHCRTFDGKVFGRDAKSAV